uniref:Peptide deformylase n=1 Tax=Candidatus Kentrum sp. MB TaxID=2138164 RepID=A0A450XD51_9GAMM|nr:MAG: peptide deformylase [Candidatus Kentron sp. MB]VFK27222.1 MAG: peptide deformylase [Candidatus Kentron sp. MB]VFK75099.1 MAG: peptide deformylase [Candidatus Kentron sp. MB]
MPLLTILHYPDPRLRNQARPVEAIDEKTKQLIDDMFHTMYASEGIGLAATQVDVHQRIIVIDTSREGTQPLCFINPEIREKGGNTETQEGCLSVPDIHENVKRAQWIRVTALDQEGNPFQYEASDITAVCLQHEIDHLDGKLFVDHLSRLKRQRIQARIQKQQRKSKDNASAPLRP